MFEAEHLHRDLLFLTDPYRNLLHADVTVCDAVAVKFRQCGDYWVQENGSLCLAEIPLLLLLLRV